MFPRQRLKQVQDHMAGSSKTTIREVYRDSWSNEVPEFHGTFVISRKTFVIFGERSAKTSVQAAGAI